MQKEHSATGCAAGCKIKQLRTRTNTYIKTPVRGEEPKFVITGRKEDVDEAKKTILAMGDELTRVRERRAMMQAAQAAALGGVAVPGQVTLRVRSRRGWLLVLYSYVWVIDLVLCTALLLRWQVRVPYKVVGLVVGPKGATIRKVQQDTQTYILTPSREKEPVFDITGTEEHVLVARKQIEAHVALRTGQSLEQLNEADLKQIAAEQSGAEPHSASLADGESDASSPRMLSRLTLATLSQ